MSQITGLMPLRISRSRLDRDFSNDLERACVTVRTIDRLMRAPTPFHLVVVAPGSDCDVARAELASMRLERTRVEILNQAALISQEVSDSSEVSGSIKQQLIKLAFADFCPSQNYLTLDSDIILNKQCDVAALEPDGRGLIQSEPVKAHPEWWAASAEVLGGTLDYEQGMSVTPAVMSAEGGRELIRFLAARDATDWRQQLVAARQAGHYWTEYTLYYHFLKTRGLLERLHNLSPKNRLFGPSVWRVGAMQDWSLEQAQRADGWFSVLQSSAGITVPELKARLQSLLL